jgi:hypothetical protein
MDSRGNSVRREDNGCTFWHFIGLVNEDNSALFKSRDHMLVMDNLFTDIDRSSVEFKGFFNSHNCAVNACTISTWRG